MGFFPTTTGKEMLVAGGPTVSSGSGDGGPTQASLLEES